MRFALAIAAAALLGLTACGDEIGDSCAISSECSPRGDRFCDTTQPGGYCTIVGCAHGSCPDEAVCVRFFPVGNTSLPCNPQTEDRGDNPTDDCTFDEICTIGEYCAPRSAELRFCMKTCESTDDCRDDYECRGEALMKEHGGEPVPPDGDSVSSDPQPFCAAAF